MVVELTNKVGRVSQADYQSLHNNVESARSLAEKTRRDLDLHTDSHGC
jgi:hypothetical protein